MFDYIRREGNQATNFLATRARDWMLQPTSKTTVEICCAFDTVRDCCKDDLAEQTYFRLKVQKAGFNSFTFNKSNICYYVNFRMSSF